jgi:hypothetical protein
MLQGKVIPFTDSGDRHRQDVERAQIVIQIGRDRELLRLRAQVIGTAGYTVHSMTPEETMAEVRKARGGQVWVFCHTLEFYELAFLAVAIRSTWPEDKLLRLSGLNDVGQATGLFDELLEPVKGVDDLLRAVAGLANQSSVRKPERRSNL